MAQKNDTPARPAEWSLMVRGIFALLLGKTIDLMPFVEADRADEVSKNPGFAAQTSQQLRQWRQEYKQTIAERLLLLRRNTLWSFAMLGSAVVVALALSRVVSVSPKFTAWLGGSSLFCFAWATFARIGWAGTSWSRTTVIERLDERIFRSLYWLGTFLGTLALT